jgi:hypothetical protein
MSASTLSLTVPRLARERHSLAETLALHLLPGAAQVSSSSRTCRRRRSSSQVGPAA